MHSMLKDFTINFLKHTSWLRFLTNVFFISKIVTLFRWYGEKYCFTIKPSYKADQLEL